MLLRSNHGTFAATARYFSVEVVRAADKGVSSAGTAVRDCSGDTLGKRLLSLVYPKRNAVIAIRKWIEEGHKVQKYQLNRVVRELRKQKRYKHGLEVCEWMRQQPDMKLLPGDYAVHLDLIAKVRGLNSAEKFFEDLPDKMRSWQTCTALLHTYVQNKLIDKAEGLMNKMSECGFVRNSLPYNHMLNLYISNGQFEKVRGLFLELRRHTSPDIVTFNLLLTACASKKEVEYAEKIFEEMKKAKIDPDWITYSTLTNLYVKKELFEKAAFTVKQMEQRVSPKIRVSYSSLLSLYTSMANREGVHRIWGEMKSCFRKLSNAEYACMISSLIKLGEFQEAENLYTEWESVSGSSDATVPNVLLAAYINKSQTEDAENFYHRMVQKGISSSYTTWELLTWGHLKKKRMDKALDCLKKAICSVENWAPNKRLVKELFKNLEEQGNTEIAEQLLVTLRKAGYVNTDIYNSLLRTYSKAGKMPLIVAERMKKDNVELDEETRKLIQATSNLRVSEVSSCLS